MIDVTCKKYLGFWLIKSLKLCLDERNRRIFAKESLSSENLSVYILTAFEKGCIQWSVLPKNRKKTRPSADLQIILLLFVCIYSGADGTRKYFVTSVSSDQNDGLVYRSSLGSNR